MKFLFIGAAIFVSASALAASSSAVLYTWKDSSGNVAYSVMEPHGKQIEFKDLESRKMVNVKQVERKLKSLIPGTHVTWNEVDRVHAAGPSRFTLPDESSYNRIRQTAAKAGLKIKISQPSPNP